MKKFVVGCARHFISGTISVTDSNGKAMLLDYDPIGTAACDNAAYITFNGHIYLR